MKIAQTVLTLSLLMTFAASAFAAEMKTDMNGMTLYTFDKDKDGASVCYGDCATKWPPYLGKAEDALTEGWTLAKRTDNTMQWSYDGKPVYYFQGDKAKGDAKGEGMGGVWHVIKE